MTRFRKAVVSWKRSAATSCGWSFFYCPRPWTPGGDLIAEGHVFLSQGLEAAVIVHLLPDLRGLLGGNAFTELFALQEPLKDKVGAAPFGLAWSGLEELLAQGSAAEAVNGLHILKQRASFKAKSIEMVWHAAYCIYTDTISKREAPPPSVTFIFGYSAVTHPIKFKNWDTAPLDSIAPRSR